jgi:hypothetical protein
MTIHGQVYYMEEEGTQTPEDENEARLAYAKMLSSVVDAAISNLSLLSTQAWHHLGLQPLPGLEGAEADLEQARLAIDIYGSILERLDGRIEPDLMKDLKRNLMTLQMNFVERSRS